jgi:hypothetical protein
LETVELRPLSLGELLDRTFTLYRNHFWVFVGIMAIPSSFSIPLNYLVLAVQGNAFFLGKPAVPPSPKLIATIFLAYFAFSLLLMLVYSIAVAAMTYAVSEAYLGRKATIRRSYRTIQGKFWRVIGVVINALIRIVGVFLLVVLFVVGGAAAIAGIVAASGGRSTILAAVMVFVIFLGYLFGLGWCFYFALRYAVSIPALLLENLKVLTAIRRSVQLTRGRRGHIFLAFLLATIIAYVGVIVFQMPFIVATMMDLMRNHPLPAWLALLSSVSGAIGGAITGPISMIVLVLCYYDTRIRKEAFDLQFMMASLDVSPPAPAAVSPT